MSTYSINTARQWLKTSPNPIAQNGLRLVRSLRPDDILLPHFVPVPWYPQDTRLQIERDGDGAVTGLRLSCDMVRGVEFTRLP